jgi:Tol biopolymer transport system component
MRIICHSVLRLLAAVECTSLGFVAAASVAAQEAEMPRLHFVTAARQLGPVGYRDPLGVISPDGERLAYTSGGQLMLMNTAGGPAVSLGRFRAILSIAWRPDGSVAALAVDAAGSRGWVVVDTRDGTTHPAWTAPFPNAARESGSMPVDPQQFWYVAWSGDGSRLAGIINSRTGPQLWVGNADGTNGRLITAQSWITNPVWTPDGKTVACLALALGHQRVSMPCGGNAAPPTRLDAYGPIAFSADGRTLYFASPGSDGTLDLYAQSMSGGASRRITSFARDTYAPSVSTTGRLVFGSQDFRAFIAVTPASGGRTRQLTAFQSETPTWSRDDHMVGITYGSWRRVVDDMHYPDISQDLAVVSADGERPATAPARVIRKSPSEDQGLDWSPDGRWIALHSHADGLDDVWLQPADGSAPAHAVTRGGVETGWPRWSPDGHWIAYSTELPSGPGHGVAFMLGVDPRTGEVTRPAQRLPLTGIAGDIEAVEWLSADSIVILASEGLGRNAIYVAARDGGAARVAHRFTSEQRYSGIGVGVPERWVAYIAPASDGHFQVFRVPLAGGAATQVTTDPTDKTQPSVSHDGRSIAFTVFSYQMQFWVMDRE